MDAVKKGFKYLSVLISSTFLSSDIQAGGSFNADGSQPHISDLVSVNLLNTSVPIELAQHRSHRSHSSHRSHQSHSSHRSSAGSGYRAPPARQVAPPTSSQQRRLNEEVSSTGVTNPTDPTLDMATVIARVQLALSFRGYYTDTVDGVMGPNTRAAITSFRRDTGLREDGYIDADLLNALNISIP